MATSIVEYFGPPPKIKIGVKLTKQIKETRTNKLGIFFDVILHPNTLIEPKIDSGNSLDNMFPYLDLADEAFEKMFIK